MTDSMDEWDGGAIDGRDQYLADAPYWNGDGETVDGTDPDAAGEVTTENVPDPGAEPGADGTDESETETSANDTPIVEDDKDLREWPPDSDTLTEIRQRLIDGESAVGIASEFPVHQATINNVAKGIWHAEIDAEIGPVEVKTGTKRPTWGEVDSDEQTELTNLGADDTGGSEVPTWPPNAETLTELRRRLLDGASAYDVGEWVGVTDDTIRYAAKGNNYSGVDADIPPLTTESHGTHATWVVDEATAEAETEPETERPDNGKWGGGIGTDQYIRYGPNSNGDGETVDATDSDPEPKSETATTDAEEEPESGPGQQESGLVSGDERPVARDPPEPETPTVPTRWIVAVGAFVAGWTLSRLVRGGSDE